MADLFCCFYAFQLLSLHPLVPRRSGMNCIYGVHCIIIGDLGSSEIAFESSGTEWCILNISHSLLLSPIMV